MKHVVLFILGVMTSATVVLSAPASEAVVAHTVKVFSPAPPVTILAFGDLMLDRTVRDALEQNGPQYPFADITQLLADHDIVIANAEGVFTANKSVSQLNHGDLRFTFATETLPVLKSLGFSALSQANNHALDFGQGGLQFSKDAIVQNGMLPFGDPLNQNPGPVYITVRGETVALVGYMELFNPGASSTLTAIAQAHERGAFTVVYPHWGEEYNLGTTTAQTQLAHSFIDAGADAVLGSHPHVVEPVEIYKGKPVFYSMGNFVFDQRWNEAVSRGLAVEISLTKDTVSYRTVPFLIVDAQPTPAGQVSNFVLER